MVAKCKQRRAFSYSTGTDDPRKAAQSAIAWVVDKQKELVENKDELVQKTENSLHKYWDEYFQRECRTRQNRRNFKRWKREELLKWDAEEYGIKNQKWSQFSADLIGRGDFEDYFSVLESSSQINGIGIYAEAFRSVDL